MRMSSICRALLHLYPANFRKQFSAEIICVFEQRAGERSANGKSASFAFFLGEFSSLVKGAIIMWQATILTAGCNPSSSETVDTNAELLSIEEVADQRDSAIRNMVAAIARHDFGNARRYSYEEVRLKRFLEEMEVEAPKSP
jgi:hypothetical protein